MEKQKKILIGVGAAVGIAAIYFIVRPKKPTYVPTTVVVPPPVIEKKPTDTWGKVIKGIDDLFKVYKKNTTISFSSSSRTGRIRSKVPIRLKQRKAASNIWA
jgi:hypothetical protein